jgi:hypothetical protein
LGNSSSKEKAQRVAGEFREHNQRLGTSFPDNRIDSELILIDRARKLAIAFDPGSRKICLVLGPKDQGEVLDFSFIRQWQLKWTESNGSNGYSLKDVHFDFSTNDLRRPLIRVPVVGKGYGDTWNSRLGILFNA